MTNRTAIFLAIWAMISGGANCAIAQGQSADDAEIGASIYSYEIAQINSAIEQREKDVIELENLLETSNSGILSNFGIEDRRNIVVTLNDSRPRFEATIRTLSLDLEKLNKLRSEVDSGKVTTSSRLDAIKLNNIEFDSKRLPEQLKKEKSKIELLTKEFSGYKAKIILNIEVVIKDIESQIDKQTRTGIEERATRDIAVVDIDGDTWPIASKGEIITESMAETAREWLRYSQIQEASIEMKNLTESIKSIEDTIVINEQRKSEIIELEKSNQIYPTIFRKLDDVRYEFENLKRRTELARAAVDRKIIDFLDASSSESLSLLAVLAIFGALMFALISGFFRVIAGHTDIVRTLFSNDGALQFVTLFSIIIAIIIFGITRILGGNELAALLGSLSGYILGKSSGGLGRRDPPAPAPAPAPTHVPAPDSPLVPDPAAKPVPAQ